MQGRSRWKRVGTIPPRWEHRCPEGVNLVLSRTHLNIFWVSRRHGESQAKIAGEGFWDMDPETHGCPWCGAFPPELEATVAGIRQRHAGLIL